MSRNCFGSKVNSCYSRIQPIKLKPRRPLHTPLPSLAINKPSPSNYDQQLVSLACGSSWANARKPTTCSPLCITGLRKGLIRLTYLRQKHCSMCSRRVGDGLLRGGWTGPRIAPAPRACVLPCPETTIWRRRCVHRGPERRDHPCPALAVDEDNRVLVWTG